MMSHAENLKNAARSLSEEAGKLKFSEPVAFVYNPLDYAWESHARYLEKYGNGSKKIVFLGMNPGPWGMVQTGIPFGEIESVRQWLKIETPVNKPPLEHPKRPVEGFECQKSEVSGRRLWGLFKERFLQAEYFFKDHFVANYCPLVFMEESSRNRTPDKLTANEKRQLFSICDRHLQQVVDILKPHWLIGVGAFAESRAKEALKHKNIKVGKILHPSPASPAANRDWANTATQQLLALKVWE